MKRCPQCSRIEPDDALVFCRVDGAQLIAADESITSEDAATRTLPSSAQAIITKQSAPTATATRVLDQREVSLTHEVARSKRRRILLLGIGVVALIFVAALAYINRTPTRATSDKNSIAVLPFANASGDKNMEYLSDGISESLINSLSQLPNIRVMARSTTFSFKGKDSDPSAVGRTLGVSAVLTGRIVQMGDNLMVQADLVNVADGSQLWGERFNRKATDLISVQEEIAQRIVERLSLRLTGAELSRLTKRYTDNIEAYRSYLKGRYEWNKRSAEGLKAAVDFFNQAIALDPTYALAHAGLADTYVLYPQYVNAPFEESLNKAKAESLKALESDSSLAEAHISLANVKHSLWEWNEVEEGYKRGLALNPNYATGHQWYSEYLVVMGRLDEAEKEITLAQQLDPMSLIINVRVGMTSYFARHYDRAEKQLRDALQFDPHFILTNLFLFNVLVEEGRFEEAIPYLVTGGFNDRSESDRARIESSIRSAYAKAGTKGGFETVRDIVAQSEKDNYSYPMVMAITFLYLRDKDTAFLWLNRAADVKHPGVMTLKVDPGADYLRNDPRFHQLMRRIGLDQ